MPLVHAGLGDVMVAKLTADLDLVWVQHAGGAGVDTGRGVGLDRDGTVFLTGDYMFDMDWGAGPLANSGGTTSVFVTRFGP